MSHLSEELEEQPVEELEAQSFEIIEVQAREYRGFNMRGTQWKVVLIHLSKIPTGSSHALCR